MIPLPNKKYKIVYCDFPVDYKCWSQKGEGRTAKHHYNTMLDKAIKAFQMHSIMDQDSVLISWATYPHLNLYFQYINAWNKQVKYKKDMLKYKTCLFTWVKMLKHYEKRLSYLLADTSSIERLFKIGMGHYSRANPEICLLFGKGKPLPRESKAVRNLIITPIGRHSEKPKEVKERIVTLFGDVPRIELFARPPFESDGWDYWGNEVPFGFFEGAL